jgi:cytoplasmic iron level regulating protein YaaA (DUF328/UPF0246 family)
VFTVLSPAKKINEPPAVIERSFTQPNMLDHTAELMKTAKLLSQAELQALMGLSEKLTELNWRRFQDFSQPFSTADARQAALCFNGDTYLGLGAETLSDEDLDYAQQHVGILSGLYGLLRPLDLIQPYRLEMGTALQTARGKSLYAFWGEHISEALNTITADHPDNTLINLSSNEYFKSVDKKRLNTPIVTPVFQEEKDGRARVISFMAKKARGMMARYAITERLDTPVGLKDFTDGGYRFEASESTDTRWVFRRPQPPPAR